MLIAILCTGCLSKEFTITSEPSGALISINDREIGTTPVTTEWHGGGTYRFDLYKPGYSRIQETVHIKYRWYSAPVIDIGADLLTSKEVKDHRELSFTLVKAKRESLDEVKKRAEKMRQELSDTLSK